MGGHAIAGAGETVPSGRLAVTVASAVLLLKDDPVAVVPVWPKACSHRSLGHRPHRYTHLFRFRAALAASPNASHAAAKSIMRCIPIHIAFGPVAPVDALLTINELNLGGVRLLLGPHQDPPYFDVNDDEYVTAQDVLHVINRLNAALDGGAAGELSELAYGRR